MRGLVVVVALSLSFGVTMSIFAAQSSGGTNATQDVNTQQAQTFTNGVTQSGVSGNSFTSGVAGGVGSCAAGAIVNYSTSLVNNLLGSNTNIDKYKDVSITSYGIDTQSGGSSGWPPSKDSIAYCMINAMIAYITNATIDWINTGFDGNPAFVQNPQQFFQSLADQTTAGFIQQVVGQTTGLNICQPFRLNIAVGLGAGSGGCGGGNDFACRSQCTLGDIGSSIQAFDAYTSGNSANSGSLNNWLALQQDQNNPIGAYFLSQKELERRVALQQNTATLDLTQGNGFLSFTKCTTKPDTKDDAGNTVKGKPDCKKTTPGHVIEDQLNNTLHAGTNRLVVADKFDQMVTALVNELIKTALDKVLTSTNK